MPIAMKRHVLLTVALIFVVGLGGVAAADAGPLADAGLDQEVASGTTVHLDATGSSHPDGSIENYDWVIETPNGRQIRPACRDCARTEFTPTDPGRYDVTVTVTDANDRADSDTLFVYVNETGPTVALDGEPEPTTNSETSYLATANTTNADLETLTWRVDNRTLAEESLNGTTDGSTRSLTFTEAEPRRLEVIVRDAENRTASDVLLVDPQEPNQSPDETDDADRSAEDSPDEFSAQRADSSVEQPVERESTDCINGVYVDGNAGCLGHISDPSHTDQEEGCEKDFCGVQNPAGETDTIDELVDDDPYSNEVFPDFRRDYRSADKSSTGYQRSDNSDSDKNYSHAIGGRNSDSGYIGAQN